MANNSKRTASAVASGSRSASTSFNSSDLLPLLDRPIAYQRIFAHVCGDPIAAIFLSQVFFWTPRTQDPDGWFFKTQSDWFDETALTRRHQETARKKLVTLGILEEVRRGIPAKLFFRLNLARLAELIRAYLDKKNSGDDSNEDGENEQSRMAQSAILKAPKSQPRLAQSANQESHNAPDNIKEAKNTAKTSSNTTTSRTREKAAAAPLDVDEDLLSQMAVVGVTEQVAKQLLSENAEECRRQLLFLPHRDGVRSRAATLVKAIREEWAPPEKWLQTQEAEQRANGERQARKVEAQRKQAEQEERQKQEAAESERAARLDAEFEKLDAQTQREIAEQARQRMGVLGRVGTAQGALMAMRRAIVTERIGLI